jgi:hypothetical protein
MKQALAAAFLAAAAGTSQAQTCEVRSTAPPLIVELYTSEGCSSCPPADRWLSTLKGRSDVLALGFHVNYWDRLGWPDRFASREATDRQYLLARAAGSAQVYTPQVVVDGRDWRGWPSLPAKRGMPAAPALQLTREGDQVRARVEAGAGGARSRLAGYWVVLEDGHSSKVRAGENAGETLKHDHVVRLYRPVEGWRSDKPYVSQLSVGRGEAAFPRRVAFVVTDEATLRPVQALAIGC